MTRDAGEPFEIELGRVVTAVTAILARDMDEIFQDLVHRGPPHRLDPRHQAALAANRIVVLCRRLTEALKRYEDSRWWEPEEDDDDPADDIPF
jgi:hypothetical protein